MQEPRFLLDRDSICYGCGFYRHISECDTDVDTEDVDENGGVCDTEEICIAGTRNTYKD